MCDDDRLDGFEMDVFSAAGGFVTVKSRQKRGFTLGVVGCDGRDQQRNDPLRVSLQSDFAWVATAVFNTGGDVILHDFENLWV